MMRLKATLLDEEKKLSFRNQNKSQRIRSQHNSHHQHHHPQEEEEEGIKNKKKNDSTSLFLHSHSHNKGINKRNSKDEEIPHKSNETITLSLIAKVISHS